MSDVFLGLGSNVGDKEQNIRQAVEGLRELGKVKAVSSFITTKPMYYQQQPDFLNAVVQLTTNLTPQALHEKIKEIENNYRKKTFKNGPREIDIDILFYNNLILQTETLTIPHPKLQERLFVLKPLNELAPNLMHPVLQKTVKELLDLEVDH